MTRDTGRHAMILDHVSLCEAAQSPVPYLSTFRCSSGYIELARI